MKDVPEHFSHELFGKRKEGELSSDAWVDSRLSLADVEPYSNADQDAEERIAPVDQKHHNEFDEALQNKAEHIKCKLPFVSMLNTTTHASVCSPKHSQDKQYKTRHLTPVRLSHRLQNRE